MDRIISGCSKERDFTKSTCINGNDKLYSNINNNYFHSNIIKFLKIYIISNVNCF